MTDMTDDELLQLVRRGLSDGDIARALEVGTTQAAACVDAALARQGLHSRAEAVIAGVLGHDSRGRRS